MVASPERCYASASSVDDEFVIGYVGGIYLESILSYFEQYSELDTPERKMLNSLVGSPTLYRRNTTIWQYGDRSENIHIVRSGWAYSYRDLEDGGRQVLDIYVPGDIIGLREYPFKKRITALTALRDTQMHSFPKARLAEVFACSQLICNIFFMIAAQDQAIMLERMINLGRRSAREKIAHFLVEIARRVHRNSVSGDSPTHLPIPQTVMADALGLSAVHVSRTFRDLREEGLVQPSSSGIEILDLHRLSEVANFDPSYLDEDAEDEILGFVRSLSASGDAQQRS